MSDEGNDSSNEFAVTLDENGAPDKGIVPVVRSERISMPGSCANCINQLHFPPGLRYNSSVLETRNSQGPLGRVFEALIMIMDESIASRRFP